MRVRLAWTLFGLTALTAVLHVAVLVLGRRPLLSEGVMSEGFPFVIIGALCGAFVGALIISRYPGHPIGWLFLVGQLLSELGVALGAYGYAAVTGELDPAPGGQLAVWLSVQTGGLFVVAMLGVLFLLAPDGRLASPRWGLALGVTVAGLVTQAAVVMTVSPSELDPVGQLREDPGPALVVTLIATTVAVFSGVIAGALSMWLRLRRATGEEHQQLRLMVLAALLLVVGMLVNTVADLLEGPTWLREQPLMAAYACLPVLTAVAILRYRLYDIDVFLNRAITLTILTGLVTVGYVAVVVVIGAAMPFTRGLFWPSLLATALVALAVQPARERAERLAARLVYGERAAPYVALVELSKRLQESPGTEQLLQRIAQSVVHAVGARRATVAIDGPDHLAKEATWPDQVTRGLGETTTVPVTDAAGPLGRLTVTMPPRTSLQPEEQRLLADFALQLAQAFRNMRLQSALADRVDRLRESTAALEASGRRLALAQDTERRRFEEALTRDVVPHLQRVREGLIDLLRYGEPTAGVGDILGELTARTRTALESLRGLTRGVFPTQLERRGLVAALDAHVAQNGTGRVSATPDAHRRLERNIESTAYFCAVELLRELDGVGSIALSMTADRLEVAVTGPSPAPPPDRVEHLDDRAAALDGSLTVSEAAGLARMVLLLPLRPPDGVPDVVEAPANEVFEDDAGVGIVRH